MSAFRYLRAAALLSVATMVCGLSACSAPLSSRGIAQMLTPYRFDRVQGNVVTQEQVQLLKPGMSKSQVRDILGTPLLETVFRSDRWDYVFTLVRQGAAAQERHFAVYFKGDVLDHFDAGDLPAEDAFVASIDSTKPVPADKLPRLEAAPGSLAAFAPAPQAAVSSASVMILPRDYPPLESGSR